MLQWIHDRLSKVFWLIMAPLTIVFTLWGVHGVVDFTSGDARSLKVNGEVVPTDRLRQEYQQKLAELSRAYPDEIPKDTKKAAQDSLIDLAVNTALLAQRVKALRYSVSDQEVIDSVKNYPAFQVDGQFNKDAYYALLKTRGYTPEKFEGEQRAMLRTRALESALMISAFVTPDEVKQAVALQGETREVGVVTFPVAHYLATQKPDAAAVKAYFEAHAAEFKTADSVHLSYVALKVADATAPIDEGTLKAYFETIKERYTEPEKRRARHILIQAGSDPAAAQKKIQEIYAESVKPGADFSALAKKYSQDAGSAQQGGDLGLAEKSFFVGAFADAVFSMTVGEIKGPVKTPFGWHVIKLDEIAPGKTASFNEVKAEVEKQYRKTEGERKFGEQQEKIEQLAFEASGSLEPIARALGLKIEDIADFHDGLEGNVLAANPKVVKAAFSADVLAGQNSKPIEVAPGFIVVVRAADRKLPAPQSLEAVRSKVESLVAKEMAAKAAKAEGEALAAKLSQGQAFAAVVKPLESAKGKAEAEIRIEMPKAITRKERALPADVVKAVFAAKAPAPNQTTASTEVLKNGDVVVFALSAVKPGQLGADARNEAEKLARGEGGVDFMTYLTALKAAAEIKSSSAIFE